MKTVRRSAYESRSLLKGAQIGCQGNNTFFFPPAESLEEEIQCYELRNDQHTSVVCSVFGSTHKHTPQVHQAAFSCNPHHQTKAHIMSEKNRSVHNLEQQFQKTTIAF